MGKARVHTTEHNPVRCLSCQTRLEMATGYSERTEGPQDGNFSVCFSCGEVSIFVITDGRIALREATLFELLTFNKLHGPVARELTQLRYLRSNPNG